MNKMYLNVSLRLIVLADDEVSFESIKEHMDFNAMLDIDGVDVIDQEIESIKVKDSK